MFRLDPSTTGAAFRDIIAMAIEAHINEYYPDQYELTTEYPIHAFWYIAEAAISNSEKWLWNPPDKPKQNNIYLHHRKFKDGNNRDAGTQVNYKIWKKGKWIEGNAVRDSTKLDICIRNIRTRRIFLIETKFQNINGSAWERVASQLLPGYINGVKSAIGTRNTLPIGFVFGGKYYLDEKNLRRLRVMTYHIPNKHILVVGPKNHNALIRWFETLIRKQID